jgi:Ca2+-binding RTX toxin-like protein
MACDITNANGILTVRGTDAGDQVTVFWSPSGLVVKDQCNTSGNAWLKSYANVNEIRFFGGGGNDTFQNNTSLKSLLLGGDGSDTLKGGSGADLIAGEKGIDHLYGNGGDDELHGEGLNVDSSGDWLYGGAGKDKLYGGLGIDYLYGDDQDDSLYGGAGDDYLYGGNGNDSLFGEAGGDWLSGGNQDDTVDGGIDGRVDVLIGGLGGDSFRGDFCEPELDLIVDLEEEDDRPGCIPSKAKPVKEWPFF